MKKLHILIPSLVATASMPLVSLVGCGDGQDQPAPSTRISFNECDWTYIVGATDKVYDGEWTEQDLLDSFYIDGDLSTETIEPKNPTSFNDFVGQKRYVDLDDYAGSLSETIKHEVIVVGAQQDYMEYDESNGTFSQPVFFTFQFNNLLTCSDGLIECEWNKSIKPGYNHNYWDCDLHKFLNNNIPNIIHDTILRDGIKTVKRLSNTYSNETWLATVGDETLFELNLSDICWSNSLPGPSYTYAQENCHNGKQYKYYEDIIGQWNPAGYPFPCLWRTAVGSTLSNGYWFTSPDCTSSEHIHSWFCNNNDGSGISMTTYLIGDDFALAPCFCL